MEKIEEQAAQLERDLISKEHQTLNLLKELESAKKFVEDLKLNLDSSSFISCPDLKLENQINFPPNLMFVELNQAKLNLNKTSGDLAVIQASVESLNKTMRRDKLLLGRRTDLEKVEMENGPDFTAICNFEADQFKKMTEASRYEVIKAMTEIERTKNSIKMAEMRLYAAKKMEEAAKAVEAIAVAESKAIRSGEKSSVPDGITLSFEEYRDLSRRAQQAEDLCKTKFIDTVRTGSAHQLEVPIMEKFEENTQRSENNSTKFKFRNSDHGRRSPPVVGNGGESGFRTTTSIGDILGRKLVLQDDVVVGRHVEDHSDERRRVSLSQMLRDQSRLILHPAKETTDGKVEKQYLVQRKKFGFIQSKKKTQPLNMR